MTDLPPQGPPEEPWSPPPLPIPPPPEPTAYPPPGSTPPPGGPPPGYGYGAGPAAGYGYPAAGYGYPAPARRTNGLAIASLVCGICSFVVCPLVAIAGLITGFQARRQIRDSNGTEDGDGLAIAGLIISGLGALYLIAVAGFLVFFVALASTVPSTPTRTVPPSPTFTTTTTFG